MAKQTIVRLTDDLDGNEADETVYFGFRGTEYEIDLSAKNANAFEKSLAKYMDAGRRTAARRAGRGGGRRAAAAGRGDLTAIRSWARDHGYEISDRGRIPNEIRDAYETSGR